MMRARSSASQKARAQASVIQEADDGISSRVRVRGDCNPAFFITAASLQGRLGGGGENSE